MQLTKAQIEQVKYQLKKLEATATNDEVRDAANDFKEFDATAIADKVVTSRTTSISNGTEQGQGSAIAPTTEPTEVINQEQLDMLPSVDEPASLANYEETSQMVQAQAQEMGVVLSDADVLAISDNIKGQSTDVDEINQEIRSAISAYIQYHKSRNLSKITNLMQDVYREQTSANNEVSQALASGLQQFSRDMEVSRNHTKSTVRNVIKCFAIPVTEA